MKNYRGIFTLLCLLISSVAFTQSLQNSVGVDEYWSTVGFDGLVPTERSRIIGIGIEDLDGNSKLTVQNYFDLPNNIVSLQNSINPFNFGIFSQIVSEDAKAFSVNHSSCETFHILGSGHLEGKSLKIFENGWCDFVFNDSYKPMPLPELKKFIQLEKHLPGIKSKSEVEDTGLQVYEMNKILLKNIEELTLHLIAKQEELDELKTKLKN